MANHLIRDSFFGRLVYHFSGKRILTHPEEKPGYTVPEKYLELASSGASSAVATEAEPGEPAAQNELEKKEDGVRNTSTHDHHGCVIVTWDGDNDPENPHNWSVLKKSLFIAQIGFLTTAVYIGSPIYSPGFAEIEKELGISQVVAILSMSLFVVGYAIGPMVFSPLSEHPAIGRTYIYIGTLFIFVILQIPTALVKNIASFLVLRFLGGLFSSPALATGPASIGDVLSLGKMPIGLAAWSVCANCGPSLGPLVGGALAQEAGWRWTSWFMLCISGFCLIMISFFLPETSQETLLYRKTKRLRALTGNENLISDAEIKIAKMNAKEIIVETFWRPLEIIIRDQSVFCIDLYIGLTYSITYCYFESIPISLGELRGFNSVQMGLSYLSIVTGLILGGVMYIVFVHYKITKPIERGEYLSPDVFMTICIVGTAAQPVGVFLYGWTSTPSIHWISPTIGTGLFGLGQFLVFQSLLNYLSRSFPRYMASVFAGNNLFRAGMAAAFPLFADAMFRNLGPSSKFPVGWGSTILAVAISLMLLIPLGLIKYGARLRAASKYAN